MQTLRIRVMVASFASLNPFSEMLPEVSSRIKMFRRPSATFMALPKPGSGQKVFQTLQNNSNTEQQNNARNVFTPLTNDDF